MSNTDLILLIEDEYVSNLIMQKYMSDLGFNNYQISKNGREAIYFLNDSVKKPELIFLDLRMPLMDGFEFLEHCTQQPKLIGNSDVYILTSSINPKDMKRAEEFSRVKGFIQKPINPLHLKELLTGNTTSA
jgi:CheY-like chemotaxis protein